MHACFVLLLLSPLSRSVRLPFFLLVSLVLSVPSPSCPLLLVLFLISYVSDCYVWLFYLFTCVGVLWEVMLLYLLCCMFVTLFFCLGLRPFVGSCSSLSVCLSPASCCFSLFPFSLLRSLSLSLSLFLCLSFFSSPASASDCKSDTETEKTPKWICSTLFLGFTKSNFCLEAAPRVMKAGIRELEFYLVLLVRSTLNPSLSHTTYIGGVFPPLSPPGQWAESC